MPKTRGLDKKTILESIDEKVAVGKKLNKQEQGVYDMIQATDAMCEVRHDCIVFCVHYLPKSLNYRDKMHWSQKEVEKSIWTGLIRKALRRLIDQGWSQHQLEKAFPMNHTVVIEYQSYRTGHMDMDNNATGVKIPQDSFVTAGLLHDDNDKVVVDYRSYPPIHVHKTDECKVIIKVTPVSDAYRPKPMFCAGETFEFDQKTKLFA